MVKRAQHNFPEPQWSIQTFIHLFCPTNCQKLKYIQFDIKQKKKTFENVKLTNILTICLKNNLNDDVIFKIVTDKIFC